MVFGWLYRACDVATVSHDAQVPRLAVPAFTGVMSEHCCLVWDGC